MLRLLLVIAICCWLSAGCDTAGQAEEGDGKAIGVAEKMKGSGDVDSDGATDGGE